MRSPKIVTKELSLEEEYDQWYKKHPKRWSTPDRDAFMIEHLKDLDVPKTILDVGCGNGHTLLELAKVYANAQIYGIDLSSEGLKLAKEKVPHLKTVHKPLMEFSPSFKFDLTTCLGTAEHFRELPEELKALRKITGKHCYMEVPHNLLYSEGDHTYRRLNTRSRQWEWHLTREEWESVFEQAGFTIAQRITGKNEAWEFIWILT